jgi:hypothetical protein
MRLRAVIILVTVIMHANLAKEQTVPQTPKPAPEVAKLGYFLGDWKLDTEVKPNPIAPSTKVVSTTHNEWLEGGFFLVSRSDQSVGGQKTSSLTVFGYDPNEKTYTSHTFTSAGQIERSTGKLEANTWTWNNEHKIENELFHGRLVIETISPSSYRFKYEMAERGGWSTIVHGTATKTK